MLFGMTTPSPLAQIDSFAYRHRIAEVMSAPVLTAAADMPVGVAAQTMDAQGCSSLVVVDDAGRAIGIVTERDILRLFARNAADVRALPLRQVMASPIKAVPADGFLYVALARMMRLGLRHLAVVDDAGRPVGMITARIVLKLRVTDALVIGDGIAQADTPTDMAVARVALPQLARNLLAEGISARDIAAVISQVMRDMTVRAAELAERSLVTDGWGEAPARWSLLVLGSGGRGESLLSFDQDNAIVHDGVEADDLWFAEFGKRLNDLLAGAGIPYCDGEVMARNPQWRKPLQAWKDEVWRWVRDPAGQTVLNCDIFFDFQCVYGDRDLAEELRGYALETAGNSPFFLQLLAMNVSKMEVPIGIFGEFVTTHKRLNAKKHGLLPLVSAARAKAVRARLTVTSTVGRYRALCDAGQMHPDDFASLVEAHETILRAMLEQQLVDLDAGQEASARIEPRRLPRSRQQQLKSAFKRIRVLKTMIGSLLASAA